VRDAEAILLARSVMRRRPAVLPDQPLRVKAWNPSLRPHEFAGPPASRRSRLRGSSRCSVERPDCSAPFGAVSCWLPGQFDSQLRRFASLAAAGPSGRARRARSGSEPSHSLRVTWFLLSGMRQIDVDALLRVTSFCVRACETSTGDVVLVRGRRLIVVDALLRVRTMRGHRASGVPSIDSESLLYGSVTSNSAIMPSTTCGTPSAVGMKQTTV
jgi:hypothetical protein